MKEPTDAVLWKVLAAASSREGELPLPSPFLGARVRAVAAARLTDEHPIGQLAWRLLPALTLAGLLLSGVSVVATREAAAARRAAVASLSTGDVLLAISMRSGGSR
ncbi:MAG: hypothetical protein IPP07_23010 [Holophagales bacterium]|jgi:hypothetical protein|nr:hypothetical protein [Holophagales bacterium]MBK9967586.1 hypothetical protein [Holophagales bacterium]